MTHLEINFFSQALCRRQRLRVMLPEPASLGANQELAVLYLLHGFSDSCDSFVYNSSIARLCEGLPLCVVMPDAEKSFYTDMHQGDAYWTHVSQEVPAFIQNTFPISTSPQKTFLGGISMGGYGAAKWMLSAPAAFAQVFLFSPVTDIVGIVQRGFSTPADFSKEQMRLDTVFDLARLPSSEGDLVYRIQKVQSPLPQVVVYCGTGDFLHADVLAFVELLRQAGGGLRYHEDAGAHGWNSWESYLADMAANLREVLL